MLLVEPFFQGFTKLPMADARKSTEVLIALSCDSRAEVDALVAQAVAAVRARPTHRWTTASCTSTASPTWTATSGRCSGWTRAPRRRRCEPMHSAVHQAIAAVWRIESARIVAVVARMVRDIGVAEELAQDALVAALEHWPVQGVPDNPGAWLITAAKRRALDHLRHHRMAEARHEDIAQDLLALQALTVPDFVDALDAARQDDIGDDLLRLIFTACHPVLSPEARVALTLKLLGGLSTHEIARAFLASEPTIAQRIVRAKRTLSEARVPFELPRGDALARAPGLGAGGGLPDLQRRLHRHRRQRLDAPGPVRRGAAPGPHAGRTGAAAGRGAGPAGADGDPGLAHRGAHRCRRAARCCWPSRTAAAGTGC